MNDLLTVPYTRDEVREALFQIGDLKGMGPDGLHVVFLKRFLYIVGDELTDEVLVAINSKKTATGWNSTNIVVIHKVESSELFMQYKPINLCNVVYKII